MKTNRSPRIIFYRVHDNPSKIHLICQKAMDNFVQEKKLIIAVPNLQASQYIDELLWRMPEEGFIPHVVTDLPSAEWIVITIQDKVNINESVCLLNLCAIPSPLYQHVNEVYEFYDESDPHKTALSKQRYQWYESQKLSVHLV